MQALREFACTMNTVQTGLWWIAVLSAIVLVLAGAAWLFVWYVTRD
jgi:hypothetical protein